MRKLKADFERFYTLYGREESLSVLEIFFCCFNPRLAPMVLLRLAELSGRRGFGFAAKFFSLLNVLIFGLEVSSKVRIGGGLFLPHTVGTVIGAESIGENCTIMQGVTLGSVEPDIKFNAATRPVIGSGVLIGAGAKILGRVVVGDGAKVGANAVVLSDVPSNSVVVGVPAKVVNSSFTSN